jgi:hypothetical protein
VVTVATEAKLLGIGDTAADEALRTLAIEWNQLGAAPG